MSSTSKNITISSLLVLISVAALAEEPAPIIVSATRSLQSEVTTPASITIISREDIELSGARHISEVLRTQAGIQLRDLYGDGSRTTISMRGFSGGNAAANSLVLVDGRRLNNADLAGPALNSISLKDVERIEIIQGSAGTLFGDQAVGGVINIITSTSEERRADVEASIGSYNKYRVNAQLANSITDNLSYRASAEVLNSDNYREHNEQEYVNGFARMDYKLDKGKWFFELQSVDEELELPGALTAAEVEADPRQANPFFPDDFNKTKTNIARVGVRHRITPHVQLEAELSQREEDIDGIGFATAFAQERQSQGFTPRLITNWSTAHGEALLTVGLDYEDNDYVYDSSVAFISDVNATQQNWALYTQLVYPLTETLSTTVGVRYAEVENHIVDSTAFPTGFDKNDDVKVGEIGLSWQYTNQLRLFTRLDENYRFAKIDEQTYTSPGIQGLETQTGTSYEVGTEWRSGGYSAKILAYRLDLDNEIDFDNTAPGPGAFPGANINLPPTRREGIIVEGKTRLSDKLSLSGQVTYIDATITGGSFTGNTIPFVAEYETSLALTYQQTPSLSWYVEGHYIGERYQDSDYDNSLNRLPGFTVFNLHLQYAANSWTGGIRANNIFDKEYVGYATFDSYYPAPGINAELYVAYRF
jgi:iron complex outermembrane receptor protein